MDVIVSYILFGIYRWGGILLMPFLSFYLHFQKLFDKEKASIGIEKLGYPSSFRPMGPLIWFHAVSVGETIALIGLIRAIRNRNINILLTTRTLTSARVARKYLGQEVIHQYAPFDIQPVLLRFLKYWHPDYSILSESEIWPLTVFELSKKRIPQIIVNARMSGRSFRNWRILPYFSKKIFSQFSLVVVQSESDFIHYKELGTKKLVVSGNLKVDIVPLPCDDKLLSVYQKEIAGRCTWAAISTFEGEEDAAVYVHNLIRSRQDILTILVPRHPERCNAIERRLVSKGLKVARHTRRDALSADVDIFLGDTIGEMGLYLRMTEIAFVGRSLFSNGGQNPLEPAMLGCAILSGPNVENFRNIYQKMVSSGAVRIIEDVEKLASMVHSLLSDPTMRDEMINTAMNEVKKMQGPLKITLCTLDPYISSLVLKPHLLSQELHFGR
ncbi:3-deoxy-D-manno-octulosonic acid transferase [Candidatus Liberibacter solanacearum]|uniref:3-deoxy-D-manno-octulosonic acid transferase n=2 Tax=Candidatus Liberibacter solanacearum TaxID=556287 RepID=A0A1V2N7U9_9HYPH|nr:3-deoxy-D-manno-octulosonic acid transferase [Candidatus Liberibacter solanacearum]